MPLHLYCIAPATVPLPPRLEGVDGHPVRAVVEGGLAAWVSNPPVGGTSVERMEAHDRVVRAALPEVTPLPVRYGPPLASAEEVRGRLREGAEGYRDALARVAGFVEMSVRVTLPPLPDAPDLEGGAPGEARGTPGRRYLEARREALARAREEAAAGVDVERALDRRLGGLARESRSSTGSGRDGTVLALAHLVSRTDLEAYRGAVADLAREGLSLTASGPWPPYSFV